MTEPRRGKTLPPEYAQLMSDLLKEMRRPPKHPEDEIWSLYEPCRPTLITSFRKHKIKIVPFEP